MDQQKRERTVDVIVFGVLLVIVSAITFVLFYHQTTATEPSMYHSDMKAYILEMQGLDSGYSFPYPIFFKISAFLHLFTGPEMAVALATMLLNSLSIVLVKLGFHFLLLEDWRKLLKDKSWLAGPVLSVVAISLFFVSMVYPPFGLHVPGVWNNYLGVFTPNPFHNATYMATRPFSILAFFWYAKLLLVYEQGYSGHWSRERKRFLRRNSATSAEKEQNKSSQSVQGVYLRDYVLFSAFLLATTMTKPSFTIVLVGTAGLIMVYRMFRSGFRNFVPTLQLGLCFVPTFLDLLYQYKGVFVPEPGKEGGLGFGFAKVWSLYSENIPLAVGMAVGFPILVTLLHVKELRKDVIFRFSWQIFGMGLVMALLLYEKGFRMQDMNFAWGYMHGIFFCFVGALLVLLRATAAKTQRWWLLALQWLAYLWHVVCGLYYFWGIFQGQLYY